MEVTMQMLDGVGVAVGGAAILAGVFYYVKHKKLAPKPKTKESSELLSETATPLVEVVKPPSAIFFSDSVSAQPAMTVKPYWDGQKLNKNANKFNELSKTSAMAQVLPSLAAAASVIGSNLAEVSIDLDKLAKSASGGGEALAPFTHNGKNIVEQVTLKSPMGVTTIVSAAAVWQVASVIVAQKHMADISAHLKDISQVLGKVHAFQKNKRRSEIGTVFEYCEKHLTVIVAGETQDVSKSALEQNEKELNTAMDHLNIDVVELSEDIKNVEHSEFAGTEELYKELLSKQEDLNELLEDWSLAVQARVYNCQLFAWTDISESLLEEHKQSIKKDIDAMLSNEGVLKQLSKVFDSRVGDIDSMFNSSKTLKKRRMDLRSKQEGIEGDVHKISIKCEQVSGNNNKILSDLRGATDFVLDVREGELVGIYETA